MTLQDYLTPNLQDLQIRGMAKSTQDDYVRAVQKISQHYNKLPDQITEDDLREYFSARGGSPALSKKCKKVWTIRQHSGHVWAQILLHVHP